MTRALGVMLLTTASNWRGSGISFSKIARGLAARGHRVELVVSSDAVAGELARLGIPARLVRLDRTGLREVRALLAVARENDTDVVIADKPRDVRLAAWMSMLRPIKIVIRYNRVGKQRPARFVDKWTSTRAAAALYQSNYIREKALAELPVLGKIESFVVPNGYDASGIASSAAPRDAWRAAHGIAQDAFVVISAGFAEAEKRFDLSADALALLVERRVEATFVFCGDGPCRASLEARAAAGGVRAVWLGAQSPRDALTAIGASDVLVHPSPVEIFGNVLAEAMALGTPVIAMHSGGNPEMLGDDGSTSILLHQLTPEAFARAIEDLHDRPERGRALAHAARERLATVFPLTRMIDDYDDMLRRLTGVAEGAR
jgi:glycosyltransferase involved in cell wall biosynthesis